MNPNYSCHHNEEQSNNTSGHSSSVPTLPPPPLETKPGTLDTTATAAALNNSSEPSMAPPSSSTSSSMNAFPQSPPSGAIVNARSQKGKFTVQFTSKSAIKKRDVVTPPSPPASPDQFPNKKTKSDEGGDEADATASTFENSLSGSFGRNASKVRSPTTRRASHHQQQQQQQLDLSFRPDLNEDDQKYRCRLYREMTRSARLLEDAKAASFVVVTKMENHVTSLKDMKWRLKALVAESYHFHQHIAKKNGDDERTNEIAAHHHHQKSKHNIDHSTAPPPVGSPLFTELLIDDVDVMFQHCMHTMTKAGDVSSMAEGAVLAFRHSSEQLNKIKLWVE